MLSWHDDDRFVVGGTTLQALPSDWSVGDPFSVEMDGADLLVFKPRRLIERYADLIGSLRPRNVFELGILQGGSTALLHEIAHPDRLVAIDRESRHPGSPLDAYVAQKGLEEVVHPYSGVDQADRARLAQILDEEFGDAPLDLVVDDCSHYYVPTRKSFNELFPRLRPGGLYLIEDWPWAHPALGTDSPEGLWPDRIPLTRLIFELVLAIPSVPGLIDEVTVEQDFALVRRGDAEVDARGFDIAKCSNPRGRRLLADRR